jgi:hypothetical protein
VIAGTPAAARLAATASDRNAWSLFAVANRWRASRGGQPACSLGATPLDDIPFFVLRTWRGIFGRGPAMRKYLDILRNMQYIKI